jgi:PEP-CTERM motif
MPDTIDKRGARLAILAIWKAEIMKLRSLFVGGAAALLLTATFAPRAEAQETVLLYYFNFQDNSTNPNDPSFSPPYLSVAAGTYSDGTPLRRTTMVNGEGSNLDPNLNVSPFPSGAGAGMTIQPNGTTVNRYSLDTAPPPPVGNTNNNLQLRASTAGGETTVYCFTLGGTMGMDFSGVGVQEASISFALQQLDGGGPAQHGFTTLTLAYSLDGTTFTDFETFTNLQQYISYTTLSTDLPTAVNGDSSVWVSFCFTGATDAGLNNITRIDNIQVLAVVPEPSTYIGGLLGIAGLFWFQRRWFSRALRFRRA